MNLCLCGSEKFTLATVGSGYPERMRTAHAQHVITEHQRLVYTRPLPDKVQDISVVA
ncbi:hypothetical protein GWK90_04940 [Candidatus Hamiltonella defensa]|uniref:hypothetical protein n=1 Tax=Candidatus Williamhamiltonella defendens TaxID=138072 RepID=UPI0015833956|nr:hypothetical protein [Candidatus Hamiltonella defensa]MBK4361623.1 hypothetical protein [Candidatus Hamiltonella defensa]